MRACWLEPTVASAQLPPNPLFDHSSLEDSCLQLSSSARIPLSPVSIVCDIIDHVAREARAWPEQESIQLTHGRKDGQPGAAA